MTQTIASTPPQPARSAKEQFDRQATRYDAQWNTWTETTLNWLLSHADCHPEDVALDVATGTGFTAIAFAPHVGSVVGLDVSTGMLRQAQLHQQEKGLANVTWQEGAAENLPFPDAAFSLVTCRVAPHHFLSIARFLLEVKRVLRPGGRFLLADTCVPNSNGEDSADNTEAGAWQNRVEALRDLSHVRNLSPEEWKRAIETAGLTVAELEGPVGDIGITLNDWIEKAGCDATQADLVRQAFDEAPPSAQKMFHLQTLPDGDTAFVWQRVVVKAVNNS